MLVCKIPSSRSRLAPLVIDLLISFVLMLLPAVSRQPQPAGIDSNT